MTSVYEDELNAVNAAIINVLNGGQEVLYQNRRVTRADLAELRKHRDDLHAKMRKAERGGIRVRRGVPIQ